MFRFEYDSIVAHHPYRTAQPWDHGGIKLLHIDGVNGDGAQLNPFMHQVERQMAEEWARKQGDNTDRPGAYGRYMDNCYGYTVRVDGVTVSGGQYVPDMYYQIRFQNGSMYVWLMPGPPESVVKGIMRRMLPGPCPKCGINTCRHQLADGAGYDVTPDDPLRQAAWDEPIPGLPTQSAVEAHSEAQVDEAMALDMAAALGANVDEVERVWCHGCGNRVVHSVDCSVWKSGASVAGLKSGCKVRVDDENAGWTGTVIWRRGNTVEVKDDTGRTYRIHTDWVVPL